MPANLVTGNDARDVAAYVATVAGIPGQDTGALALAGRPPVSNVPIQESNGSLSIPADPTGALAFASTQAAAKPGQVTVTMPNPSPIDHSIAIMGNGVNSSGPVVGHGGVSTFSANLPAGTYTFYCTVPGHAEGGMKGTLTVK